MAETAYARCGDLSLAYREFPSDAPMKLVIASSFVSHIELMSTDPLIKGFIDALTTFASVVVFDKAGVGLSDPVPKVRTLEERVAEIEAVMDAVGYDHAAIMGISEGGPAAIMLAATRPDRVDFLVLAGTFGVSNIPSMSDEGTDPEVLAQRFVELTGEQYRVSPQQFARLSTFLRAVRDEWGSGKALTQLFPSIRSEAKLRMLERMSASPGMARATVAAGTQVDVRHILPAVSAPTLVLHATDDAIPIQGGRYLADHIPGARLYEMPGADHAPWLGDPARFLAEVEGFLTGSRSGAVTRRSLRAVLFTDIVGSTQHAATLGDAVWHARLEQVDAATRDLVERNGGTVIKSTGDGHLATFTGPAQALSCASALIEAFEAVDLELRQGVHVGECELLGDDIGGIAVHIAARVMGQAGAGEILVSGTVRDLVVGSGLGFDDRGERELKGVPGRWRILALRPDGPAPGTREAALVAQATPAARTAMRRTDRAAAVLVRRAPGVMRTLARLSG